jgi:hypothetical protein
MAPFLFAMHKKPASNSPLPAGYDAFQQSFRKLWMSFTSLRKRSSAVVEDECTTARKKRASITSLFQPISLKGKRSFAVEQNEDEDQEDDAANRKRKYPMDSIIKKFSIRRLQQKKHPVQPWVDVFQCLVLPTIELTNGYLGILDTFVSNTEEEDTERDDCMFTDEEIMGFPSPPATCLTPMLKRRSCPPRFESLMTMGQQGLDDDGNDWPITPTITILDSLDTNRFLSLNCKIDNLNI